jgi:hypothetical protein
MGQNTHCTHFERSDSVTGCRSHKLPKHIYIYIKCGEMVCEWMCIGGGATHTFVGVELWKW